MSTPQGASLGRHYSRRTKRAASCALRPRGVRRGEVRCKIDFRGVSCVKGTQLLLSPCLGSKRQTSVSRSATESEIASLAHSLYQEGLPALYLWSVLLGRDDLELVIHEDNQATTLVVKKGYSPKLKHISRTHKVNLDCISEQLAPGSGISIQYVDTNLQAADMFTKALPPQKWDNALKLLGIRQSLPEVLEDQRRLPTKLVPKAKVTASGATVVSRHTSYRSNG